MFNHSNYLTCLFCLDDTTAGIHRQRDREAPGGISPIADCLTLGRELKIGFILVIHSISEISDIIRQNAGIYFICGMKGENPWLIRNTLGITQEQYEAFLSARPGQGICVNNLIFGKPVYFEFDLPLIPGPCDEAMRQLDLEPFLQKVISKPPAPMNTFTPELFPSPPPDDPSTGKSSPDVANLPARGFEFLVQVASNIPTAMTKLYERMGLSTTQGRRITKRLEELAYIQVHLFSTGHRGGRISLVQLTGAAWSILTSQGILPPDAKTNGGWEHEVTATLLELAGKTQKYSVFFEVDLGGIRIDVQWLDRKIGQRWLFNIGISNPEYEVDSLEKFLRLPAALNTDFTLVARDSAFAQKVKDILKQKKPDILRSSKFQIKLIADFISF